MENKKVNVRTNTSIVGEIEGVEVNISYEQVTTLLGQEMVGNALKPISINATAIIMEPEIVTEGMPGMRKSTRVTVSIDANGDSNSSVNGPKGPTQLRTLVEAMEVEIRVIWDSI